VSCAIGLAVLDVIDKEKLMEHATKVGDYFKSRLIDLQKKQPIIGDIR
jgi:4-aminobutyrate aminotransferase-like enzyme